MKSYFDNAQMNELFEQLPQNVRENIIESGAKIDSVMQLRAIAEQMTNDVKNIEKL